MPQLGDSPVMSRCHVRNPIPHVKPGGFLGVEVERHQKGPPTKKGPRLRNDMAHIAVAFDASSRVRRAGFETYHQKLSQEKSNCDGPEKVPRVRGPPDRMLADPVRVVAISDSHLHHGLRATASSQSIRPNSNSGGRSPLFFFSSTSAHSASCVFQLRATESVVMYPL